MQPSLFISLTCVVSNASFALFHDVHACMGKDLDHHDDSTVFGKLLPSDVLTHLTYRIRLDIGHQAAQRHTQK